MRFLTFVHVDGNFEHKGKIVEITGNQVTVSVTAESACVSCKAKGLCDQGQDGEKLIPAWEPYPEFYETGETVIVSVSRVMGMKAVAWAYIYPFFLMLGTLLILLQLGLGEVVAGLSSLAALVLYYICLYFMRSKVEKEIIFRIRKTDS